MARVGGSIGWAAIGASTSGAAMVSATVAAGEAGNGDDVAGVALLDRLALEAAKGQDLGDPALLDEPAVARQRLDRLVGTELPERMRPVRTRPRKGLASMVVASMRKGAGLDGRRRHMAQHEVEQRRHVAPRPARPTAPSSPAWPSRRGWGNRAARRWHRGRRTGRRPRSPPRHGARRAGRSC